MFFTLCASEASAQLTWFTVFFFCFFFGGLGGWGLFTVMLIVNAVNNN